MALALAATGEGVIDTVDVVDVNAADERRKAGLEPGSSPRQLLRSPGLEAREGADFAAVALGALPWPTKLGANITSLALLTRPSTE